MSFLAVRNWSKYQHYADRTPIWIKFYVESLHDEKLRSLPIHTRLVWDQMLLLAAMFQNAVPNSPEVIGNLTGIAPELCREAVADLLKARLLREKSSRRSASKPASTEESKKRREENMRARKAKNLINNMAGALSESDLASELQALGIDELTAKRMAAEAKAAA